MMKAYIIGGGIAGLSAAVGAADLFDEVLIYEKASEIFAFTSSRNAAMARSYDPDPLMSVFVKRSLTSLLNEAGLVNSSGLLIRPLEYDYEQATDKRLIPVEKTLKLPDGSDFSGLWISGNGVLDIEQLKLYYMSILNRKNVKLFLNSHCNIQTKEKKSIHAIDVMNVLTGQKEHLELQADDILVNAAGSWAKGLSDMAGAIQVPLKAYKRHLYVLRQKKPFEPLPIIWDETRDLYLRPHEDGFLATHCDEQETFADDYQVDETQQAGFLSAMNSVFPFSRDYPVIDARACLRTFTMDYRPIIGFDPVVKNLFWMAGLGPRGMSLSLSLAGLFKVQYLHEKSYLLELAPERYL